MDQKGITGKLILPFVVVTTLLNIPGVAAECIHARLMFMLVGLLAWSAMEMYERRAELIVGTFVDIVTHAFTAFFAKSMKRTRVCLFTTIAACSAYSITAGGYWVDVAPPFPLAPLFIFSFIWAFIEVVGLTINALDSWSDKRQL